MTGVILRGKMLVYLNAVRRAKGRRLIRLVALGLVSAALLVFAYYLAVQTFYALGIVAPGIQRSFISLIITGLVIFLLLTGVSTVLFQLYLSTDLNLLMTAPVPLRSIWVAKMIESLLGTGLPAVAGLLAVIAFGQASSAPFYYYPLAVLILLAGLSIVTAINSLIVMGIMRVVPPKRAREAVTIIGALVGAGVWAAWMLNSNRLSQVGDLGSSIGTLEPTATAISKRLQWTPMGWASSALVAPLAGDWITFLWNAGLLFGTAALLLGLSYVLFSRAYYYGWLGSREEAAKPLGSHRGGAAWLAVPLAPLPAELRSLVLKDWRITGRDMRNLSRLIFPVVAAVVFAIYFLNTASLSGNLRGLAFWQSAGIVSVIIPYIFCGAMGTRAVALEGHSFRFIRSTPLSIVTLLTSKVIYTLLPVGLLSGLVTVVVGIVSGGNLGQVLIVLAIALWFSIGLSVISVGAGALDPKFEATDPRKQVGFGSSLAWFIGSLLFVLGSVLPIGWAVALGNPGTLPDIVTGNSLVMNVITAVSLVLLALGIVAAIVVMNRGAAHLEHWQIAE